MKRLFMTKVNRPPVSTSKLAQLMSHEGRKERIAVAVATIVDDPRSFKFPKMTVKLISTF